VTHHSSRKQFFAKLLGVVGATSVLPALLAKPESDTTPPATRTSKRSRGLEVRHDSRAVARRDSL
jgi:hypothetical protein